MQLILEKESKDYVIKRVDGTYQQHSHYKDKREAEKLIEYLEKGKRPIRRYDQIAAKRLLTKEEYEALKVQKRKQMYYNVGVKKNLKSCR